MLLGWRPSFNLGFSVRAVERRLWLSQDERGWRNAPLSQDEDDMLGIGNHGYRTCRTRWLGHRQVKMTGWMGMYVLWILVGGCFPLLFHCVNFPGVLRRGEDGKIQVFSLFQDLVPKKSLPFSRLPLILGPDTGHTVGTFARLSRPTVFEGRPLRGRKMPKESPF